MFKKFSKYFITFMIIISSLFITVEPVLALHGPLDSLNVTISVDPDNERASLGGELTGNDASINNETFGNTVFKNIRKILFGGFGIATITLVGVAIVNFIKLGGASGNPQERAQVLKSLMHTGIAIALLGGITLVIGLSMALFQ